MKSKQLANVLIKMLGLSVCFYAIPGCVSGIIMALTPLDTKTFHASGYFAIGDGIQFVFGVIIISISKTVASWLFKSDED